MTAAITPGPWEVDGFSVKQPGATIAMVWPDKRVSSIDSIVRMNANAKAIAAVPAMIEALKWVRKIADENFERDTKLRAQGARTLRRIVDKADEALKLAGIEL